MSSMEILIQPLTKLAFAPFGEVLETSGTPTMMINQGLCGRYHDLAAVDIGEADADQGKVGISLFDAQPRRLPYQLDMMERHPLGSQAFLPMSMTSFLVIVAPDANGEPGMPLAFLSKPGQGINFHRNIWHGVLTPLQAPGLFAVVDRIGTSKNLQEHWFERPYIVGRTPE
ncbi:ureidoglycolate lyase [Cohaesibacter celericrescens]|uniref:Ureidoglycolate lyase n=1 Tax=Cohaesibacter celericrescens TaxID=2067669 RepID=A0A2N5XWF1_9HYPH|nr:ureidoglycolate lyase [Cohaesibacter celericrescens]PLW78809.1 Ureidoglycolate hydrolase [Cohaesibacter celericrescens]